MNFRTCITKSYKVYTKQSLIDFCFFFPIRICSNACVTQFSVFKMSSSSSGHLLALSKRVSVWRKLGKFSLGSASCPASSLSEAISPLSGKGFCTAFMQYSCASLRRSRVSVVKEGSVRGWQVCIEVYILVNGQFWTELLDKSRKLFVVDFFYAYVILSCAETALLEAKIYCGGQNIVSCTLDRPDCH